jgi:hypothetical protein
MRIKKVVAWRVLLFAAAEQGSVSFSKAEKILKANRDNLKKMIDNTENRLRSGLLLILGNDYSIEGSAFKYQRNEAHYKALFTINIGPGLYKKTGLNVGQHSSDDIDQIIEEEQRKGSITRKYCYLTSDIEDDQKQ